MATFRKRGPHQLQVQVRKKGYPVQSKTFETRAAASVWARTIEHEMDAGSFVSRVAADSTTVRRDVPVGRAARRLGHAAPV